MNEDGKKKLKEINATSISWEEVKLEKNFTRANFWRPESGVYSVEANLRDFIIRKGKFGHELWIRVKIENKEFTWSIPIADYKDNKIFVAPLSRAWQIKEIVQKYGQGWHRLIVEVEGRGKEKKYSIKHLENCGCKNE